MRVYEFSKKAGIPSKEIIKILVDAGYSVQSHMSVLTDESLNFLNAKINKTSTPLVENPKEEKKTEIKEVAIKKMDIEKQKQQVSVAKSSENTKQTEKKSIDNQKIEKKTDVLLQANMPNKIPVVMMTVGELADRMNIQSGELILNLLKKGLLLNKNQAIKETLVEQIAKEYGLEVEKVSVEKEISDQVKPGLQGKTQRPPIVVVIGHVDHGKTTLLDYVRKARVASREKGGITQHLGAYEVDTKQGRIIFLDTPGHEAFTMMRQRGVRVADIAILVVAADDGVMPQTVEAINQAQSANVPIVVAINKVDKVTPARLEEVKGQLAKYNLLAEDWGGQTICVPVSAKLGQGIDQLLEMILLQAEIMELKSDETVKACGYVLESKVEKGLGPVATFIAQHGHLKIGDFFVCGNTQGKVTILIDSYGSRKQNIGPAIPVQIAGFDDLPQAGDYLQVVSSQEFYESKEKKSNRKEYSAIKEIPEDSIRVIIKADTASSKEAILNSIEQLSKKSEKKIYVVQSGMGNITESDITNAVDTKSIIYGFSVKPEAKTLALAQRYSIPVKMFYVIYHLLDDIEQVLKSEKKIEYKKVKSGEAVVRKVFDIKNLGVIAGFYVKDGKIVKDGNIVVFRGNKKIGQGSIQSLQREKRNMKEIASGFEGALLIENFRDWSVDDRIECYIDVPQT